MKIKNEDKASTSILILALARRAVFPANVLNGTSAMKKILKLEAYNLSEPVTWFLLLTQWNPASFPPPMHFYVLITIILYKKNT
ncbi:Putative 3-methyladenine DNA glycosylase [Frankliniella fusca]|uniref:3-methyladenine DNA glycosylase n=1 Tax=Frankliniella fusca TaxID=407009 RepID=A0AAE1H1N5_9NEOP|nr:Putative 3-methyladenine DNA glycosylase [Frankliniella fusca]